MTVMLRLSALARLADTRNEPETIVSKPPLKSLHDKASLSQAKIEQYCKLSTENLIE
jgi:hypothetical protein